MKSNNEKPITLIPPVKLSTIEKLISKVKETTETDDINISFEFLIASLFPDCWNNMQNELNRQYTLGFIEGQKELKREKRERAITESDCGCYD